MDIDQDKMKAIGIKLQDGTATKEEVVYFLGAVNKLLKTLKKDIKDIAETP